jgi:hypothetical protein
MRMFRLMNALRLVGIAAVTCAVLGGCASHGTIRGAFEDLTYDGARTTTALASYHSTLSVSGLVTPEAPGMYFFEPDATRIGMLPPSLLSPISPKCSFLVESTYPLPAGVDGADAVRKVRDSYLDVQRKALAVAAARSAVAAAEQSLNVANDKSADPSKVTQLLTALGLGGKAGAGGNASAIQAELATRQNALATSEDALKKAMQDLGTAASTPNLLVMRWTRDSNVGGSVNAATYASASAQNDGRLDGILVIGDIRVRSLAIGEDFLNLVNSLSGNRALAASMELKNVGIVTYAVDAKHIAYISERDSLTAAALSLGISKNQIEAMLKDPNTKVDIAAALSLAESLANTGIISSPTTRVTDYSFIAPDSHRALIRAGLMLDGAAADKISHYSTVYTVRATVEWPMIVAMADRVAASNRGVKAPAADDRSCRLETAEPATAAAAARAQ